MQDIQQIVLRAAGVIAICVLISGCSKDDNIAAISGSANRTVNGPETPGLAEHFHGVMIFKNRVGLVGRDISASSENKEAEIYGRKLGNVFSLSGPDRLGRIAFVAHRPSEKKHSLLIAHWGTGRREIIFEHDGDPIWGKEIGRSLALSPVSGLVAMIESKVGVQLRNPNVYLMRGSIVFWNILEKKRLPFTVPALDEQISWFPDGKRVAYVDFVEREQALKLVSKLPNYGKLMVGWDRVPTVHVLDIASGKTEAILVGWRPLVNDTGDAILVCDNSGNTVLVDIATHETQSIRAPGMLTNGAIAFLDKGHLLYWGLPTTGTNLEKTEGNSPLVGPKPMLTVKVGKINSTEFQTVLPYVDPRNFVSYGQTNSVQQP